MKNNEELKSALHMIPARLESTPASEAEWKVIVDHLKSGTRYAEKCQLMRRRLEREECAATE